MHITSIGLILINDFLSSCVLEIEQIIFPFFFLANLFKIFLYKTRCPALLDSSNGFKN